MKETILYMLFIFALILFVFIGLKISLECWIELHNYAHKLEERK